MNTLATREQSEAIRNRMRSIRNELPYAMDEARDELKQLADWKYYVRKMPLTTVVCAATAAYLVVPEKPQPKSTRRDEIEQTTREAGETSFLGGVLGAVAAMALRTGTSMAVKQVSNALLSPTQPTSHR